jgi:hypothetical protein
LLAAKFVHATRGAGALFARRGVHGRGVGVSGDRDDGWGRRDLRFGEQAMQEAFRRGIVDVAQAAAAADG